MKNVLITGSAGFVGQVLCKQLKNLNVNVRLALFNDAEKQYVPDEFEQVVIGDIAEFIEWDQLLEGIDTILHLAGRAHVMNESEEEALPKYRSVNVDGTRVLAEAAIKAGVRRIVYISSIKALGERSLGTPLSEDLEPAPEDAYGISKREAEELLLEYDCQNKIEVAIVRPVLVHGPGVKGNLLSLSRWAKRGWPFPLGGITDNRRSLVGVENLADLIITLATHPEAKGQIFHVSDGKSVSTSELYRLITQGMGQKPVLLKIPPVFLKIGLSILNRKDIYYRLIGSLEVDITKAQKLLGWTPKVSIEEGFRQMGKANGVEA